MKQIPILMTTDMVLATLEGEKRQTRRPVNPQPSEGEHFGFDDQGRLKVPTYSGVHLVSCPYGKPGDQLYVRETWQHSNWPHRPYDDDCEVFYRADYANDPHGFDGEKSPEGKYRFWLPSIHMPKSRARIFLRVDNVRIERLQAVNYYDAVNEGAMIWAQQQNIPVRDLDGGDARIAFIALWESIYGVGSWDLNPWVWVIDFTKVKG